jgi:hypothetical protein
MIDETKLSSGMGVQTKLEVAASVGHESVEDKLTNIQGK